MRPSAAIKPWLKPWLVVGVPLVMVIYLLYTFVLGVDRSVAVPIEGYDAYSLHNASDAPHQNLFATRVFVEESHIFTGKNAGEPTDDNHELVHFTLLYKTVTPMTLCGPESVARAHMDHSTTTKTKLIIWTTDPKRFAYEHGQWLQDMDNILCPEPVIGEAGDSSHCTMWLSVREASVESVFSGTRFEELPTGYVVDQWYWKWINIFTGGGYHWKQNQANAFRLAIIMKHGGMYMDGDVIIKGDLSTLPAKVLAEEKAGKPHYYDAGFLGIGSTEWINNNFFKFPENDGFVRWLIDDFVDSYSGNIWGHNGPRLFTRILMSAMAHDDSLDQEIEILGVGAVSCIPWDQPELFFQPKKRDAAEQLCCIPWDDKEERVAAELCRNPDEFLGAHYWGHLTRDMEKVARARGPSYYLETFGGNLYHEACPTTLGRVLPPL